MGTRWSAAAAALAVCLASACADGSDGPRVAPTSPPPSTTAAEAGRSPDPAPGADGSPTEAAPSEQAGAVGPDAVDLALTEIASGFEAPLFALPAPGSGLLVVEQPGRIQLLRDGAVEPYLDLTDRVVAGGERGLLGAALPPDAGDGRIYVHYTGAGGRTTLAAFEAGPDAADPSSEEILLTVEQPAANHNGGQLAFGPDGHLYLGLGDGGGADDRFGNGQDPSTLLGALLRLDVGRGVAGYAIPSDNPFADGRGGAPEVWAYGLRNPYRFAFGAGRIFIADVGQNAFEEIDAEPMDAAGVNYGWPILEGPDCFAAPDCDPAGTALPVHSYRHEDTGGCAVIGGEVYAGDAIPALRGWYVYSDRCAGFLRALRVHDDGSVEDVDLTDRTGRIDAVLGFGHDRDGELLIALQDGRILRLVPA